MYIVLYYKKVVHNITNNTPPSKRENVNIK